jgi:hypothetical protein
VGQHPPGTATAHEAEDRIEDLSAGVRNRPPAGLGFGHVLLDTFPLSIGQIARTLFSLADEAICQTRQVDHFPNAL